MVPYCHENFFFTYNHIFFKLPPSLATVIMCNSKTNYYSFLGS